MQYRIFLIFFCLFTLSSCQLFGNKSRPVTVVEVPPVSQEPLSLVDESFKLDSEYINDLRLQTVNTPGMPSLYMVKKKSIIDEYIAGSTDRNLLRSYIYLSGFEGDFTERDRAITTLCTVHSSVCDELLADVLITGSVKDISGKPLAKIEVHVLGTDQKVFTDNLGNFTFSFNTMSPSVLRVKIVSDKYMIGVKKINIIDTVRAASSPQKFKIDFVTTQASQTATIDTSTRTVVQGKDAIVTNEGFLIQNDFTRYTIPFDSIVQNGKSYQGKVNVRVFEFDRSSGGFLLDSDAFDQTTHGFVSQLFITFGMPFIVFYTPEGEMLDVSKSNPMKIATTKRERDPISETSAYKQMYKIAYEVSQKSPDTYPIDYKWLLEQGVEFMIPPWWVFDQRRGFWDNVGKRFASPDPFAPFNTESIFYTKA